MKNQKINYDTLMLEEISKISGSKKPTLLLHSCCAPCSTYVINELQNFFKLTIFYYNPNIEPTEEYEKRKNEQLRLIEEIGDINFIDCDYDNNSFLESIKGFENYPEGKERCTKCIYLRINATAIKAIDEGFNYFGTTLTVSPHKNSIIINEIGELIAKKYNIKYLYSDFKKRDGYKKSIELSKKYNLYRQDYCGCLFAKEKKEY